MVAALEKKSQLGLISSFQGRLQTFEDLDQFFGPKQENANYSCGICLNFKHRSTASMRSHIEAKHFPGLFTHHCPICGEICKSKNALITHNRKFHK